MPTSFHHRRLACLWIYWSFKITIVVDWQAYVDLLAQPKINKIHHSKDIEEGIVANAFPCIVIEGLDALTQTFST
jgi:hypothetical protein